MPDAQKSLFLPSESDATLLAEKLAAHLSAGDTLLLDGPVGAGKSHFARTVILSKLLHPEDVPSPTFTLVQTYEVDGLDIWHCDLYRLSGPDDVIELGLDDAMDTALCLIEWPDRLAELTPSNALTLRFAHRADGVGRDLTLSGPAQKWAEILETLHV